MAIVVADGFSYQGSKPLDARLKYDTLADMKAVVDATMYNGCLAYCVATDKTYQWKSTNTVDADTGKWREFSSGGGSSVSPYTSNPAMNGTASPGSSDNYSRGDHVHPSDTSKLGTSGDGSNVTAAFTAASSRANISTDEKLSVIFGKIAKFFADLKTVAFSGSYNDLSNKLTAGTNIAISDDNVISTTSTYTMRYSTSEQVVGTWIDGKPLYQKSFATGAITGGSDKTISTGITNGANARIVDGYIETGAGYDVPINIQQGTTTTNIFSRVHKSANSIIITSSISSTNGGYVTIQYTKTTDG